MDPILLPGIATEVDKDNAVDISFGYVFSHNKCDSLFVFSFMLNNDILNCILMFKN